MNKKIEKLLEGRGENHIFPFFWQHGEDEDVLREYMKIIEESNIRAVCVESRPHPDFCGEQWWYDMDIILDEARKRKMKVWILDDSHFPTGFANGAMEDQPDELCRQSVCYRSIELGKKRKIHLEKEELCHPVPFQKNLAESYLMNDEMRAFDDDRLLAVYAVRLDREENGFEKKEYRKDLKPLIQDGELDWSAPEGNWKICLLHLSRNYGYHRNYINMMDRTSCRVLIDAVYEPHYRHYKEDFGTVIAGFFSDEPELGNGHLYDFHDPFGSPVDYPWSRELEERLKERLGTEYGFWLSLLWETEADPDLTAKVRYTYMNAVTQLVKEDFSEQIGTWCRKRGVQYIGHMIEDNNHHSRTGSSLGHYYRGLAGQDMAGIDDIGGQVFPQGEDISYDEGIFKFRNGEFYHYMLGKLGSSAAAIEPLKKGNSMCEIFGNYGWAEGVRLEKYLTDHFLVRGINHYVPHAFSPKEFPDPDCPPHFYAHGHNPQYRHFGYLMAYMNRVCELISGGKHCAPAAVLYHGEGDWTGAHMTSEKVGHILADRQIEFDYIPQDVFAFPENYHTEFQRKSLLINTQNYSAVIVPYMQFVTKAFAEAAGKLKENGIPVIFAGGFPEGICDTAKSECGRDKELLTVLQQTGITVELPDLIGLLCENRMPEITIYPDNDRIRYLHYIQEDGTDIWMFVNEGTEIYKGKVVFSGGMPEECLYLYDAWNNQVQTAGCADDGLKLIIEPLQSRIFVFDRSATIGEINDLARPVIWDADNKIEVDFSSPWVRSICKSIDYPAFSGEKEVVLPDCLEEEPDFSGFVRYQTSFQAKENDALWLEITDASEGVEVFVNGRSMGIQIVPVYRFDLSRVLIDGENDLRIEVATTLEREMAKIPDLFGNQVEACSRSGITGNVRLWKV